VSGSRRSGKVSSDRRRDAANCATRLSHERLLGGRSSQVLMPRKTFISRLQDIPLTAPNRNHFQAMNTCGKSPLVMGGKFSLPTRCCYVDGFSPKHMWRAKSATNAARSGCSSGRDSGLGPRAYGWRGDRQLHRAYRSDAQGFFVPNADFSTVDAQEVRTELVLADHQSAVLEKISPSVPQRHIETSPGDGSTDPCSAPSNLPANPDRIG
jgi:hypothetical protein